MTARRWTPLEDQVLRDAVLTPHTERFRGDGTFARLARRLGRTEQAVRDRYQRNKRNAGHAGGQWTHEGLWSAEEDNVIREANRGHAKVPKGTRARVAAQIQRTPEAVKQRAHHLRKHVTPPHLPTRKQGVGSVVSRRPGNGAVLGCPQRGPEV